MLNLVVCFFYSIFCSCSIFYNVALHEFNGMALFTLIWFLYFQFTPWCIMLIGHLVKRDGKLTAVLAHKIIHLERNQIYAERLEKLSQQILHRLPKFSSGLFNYDLELLFSVSSEYILQSDILMNNNFLS